MTTPISRDAETVAKALLEIEQFLSRYLEPGPRNADRTIDEIIKLLDRYDAMIAARRIVAGYGLHVVK